MGRAGSGPEFQLVWSRVGLGDFTCGSGWVGSRKLDPRPSNSDSASLGGVINNINDDDDDK